MGGGEWKNLFRKWWLSTILGPPTRKNNPQPIWTIYYFGQPARSLSSTPRTLGTLRTHPGPLIIRVQIQVRVVDTPHWWTFGEETFAVRGNVLKLQNVLKTERGVGIKKYKKQNKKKTKIKYFIHTHSFLSILSLQIKNINFLWE